MQITRAILGKRKKKPNEKKIKTDLSNKEPFNHSPKKNSTRHFQNAKDHHRIRRHPLRVPKKNGPKARLILLGMYEGIWNKGNFQKEWRSATVIPTLREAIGNTLSEEKQIENGVVQRVVLSVTLFLVAMAEITHGIEEPIKIIGYADDWIIHTTHKHE
jgi:hypothetical protein